MNRWPLLVLLLLIPVAMGYVQPEDQPREWKHNEALASLQSADESLMIEKIVQTLGPAETRLGTVEAQTRLISQVFNILPAPVDFEGYAANMTAMQRDSFVGILGLRDDPSVDSRTAVGYYFETGNGCFQGTPQRSAGYGFGNAGDRLCDDDPHNDGWYRSRLTYSQTTVLALDLVPTAAEAPLLQEGEWIMRPDQLAWLQETLEGHPQPIVLVSSQCPLDLATTYLGNNPLEPHGTRSTVASLVAQHQQVVGWLADCGSDTQAQVFGDTWTGMLGFSGDAFLFQHPTGPVAWYHKGVAHWDRQEEQLQPLPYLPYILDASIFVPHEGKPAQEVDSIELTVKDLERTTIGWIFDGGYVPDDLCRLNFTIKELRTSSRVLEVPTDITCSGNRWTIALDLEFPETHFLVVEWTDPEGQYPNYPRSFSISVDNNAGPSTNVQEKDAPLPLVVGVLALGWAYRIRASGPGRR